MKLLMWLLGSSLIELCRGSALSAVTGRRHEIASRTKYPALPFCCRGVLQVETSYLYRARKGRQQTYRAEVADAQMSQSRDISHAW
jgi:hypothetical protein